MVLKEQIYAWYPQVDVPDYTAAKPDSNEIERLYRQATYHYLERPPANNVPTIGPRISRKTAQEGEEELSPVEFLRRCKSAPLQRGLRDETSPCPSTRSDTDPKPKTKSFLTVPTAEQPTTDVANKEVTPHSRSPRQSASKTRPSSASMATQIKTNADQCARKISSARTNRNFNVQRPGSSPKIVVTPPGSANNNDGASKSPISESNPKLSSPKPAPRETVPESNGVLKSQNSGRSCVSRPMIASADSGLKGRVNIQNSNNKENTVKISYSWRPPETTNLRTSQRGYKITNQINSPVSHQSGDEKRNALQGVSITGKNVVGLGKKSKGDNSKMNPQINVLRPPEGNSGRQEVGSSKSTDASKADIRELAMKEIERYDSEDYERDLRTNGWRMELPGNKFGLKNTPVRLPYWVPLVVPKIAERPPVFHTNSTSTFFYNTIPSRPKRMVISQNWHSEIGYEQRLANINRKKRSYQYRNWSFVY